MTAKQIAAIIEEFAPKNIQESWDNAGMQTDNDGKEITGILLCLDVTEASIDEAISKGCNMIVSHHPLFFGTKLKCIDNSSYVMRCAKKAIKHDIAIYSAHTNMDKVSGGVSGRMCQKLGLENVRILEDDSTEYGLGMIGELPEPADEATFLQSVKSIFGCKALKHSALLGRKVKKAAVCGGSGVFLLDKAISEGADMFITADIKYHDFFKPENKLVLCDIGHFESEQYTKEIFFEVLSKKIDTFAIQFSEKDTNPVFCL